jgi:hypothetical protein
MRKMLEQPEFKDYIKDLTQEQIDEFINLVRKTKMMITKQRLRLFLYCYLKQRCQTAKILTASSAPLDSMLISTHYKMRFVDDFKALMISQGQQICDRRTQGHKLIKLYLNELKKYLINNKNVLTITTQQELDAFFEEIKTESLRLFDKYFDKHFSIKPLFTIIGGLLYYMLFKTKFRLSQIEISNVLNVSAVSIRRVFHLLSKLTEPDKNLTDSNKIK